MTEGSIFCFSSISLTKGPTKQRQSDTFGEQYRHVRTNLLLGKTGDGVAKHVLFLAKCRDGGVLMRNCKLVPVELALQRGALKGQKKVISCDRPSCHEEKMNVPTHARRDLHLITGAEPVWEM
jgi:hypothetical protein